MNNDDDDAMIGLNFDVCANRVPTRIERRQVEKTLEDGRITKRWARFVRGTDVEIPKPSVKYDDRSGGTRIDNNNYNDNAQPNHDTCPLEEKFTTSPEDVNKVTFTGLGEQQPPVPEDLVRELRNPYKRRHSNQVV